MNRFALPATFSALLFVAFAFGAPPDEHPSETSRVLATYVPASPETAGAEDWVSAANAFLASLDGETRAACVLPLEDDERSNWTNVPPGAVEEGARFGDLSEDQLRKACNLLAAVSSPQGYEKSRDILLADDELLPGGRPRTGFGAENYWLVIFGEPSLTEPWGLQFDGHHLALNLSFRGETMTMSPSFIGTQPARYERNGAEIVPMRGELADACALMAALSEEQRATAIVGERRGQLAAGPGRDGHVPEPAGLDCSDLNDVQREKLMTLLAHYVGNMPEPHAGRRLAKLETEIDRMRLAWRGPYVDPSDASYRIQGPSVLIEYASQDLGGDPLDHLHSIYRDPTNEYGAGLAE